MIESLFEKQQNPVPGPLDAEFHVLLLAAGTAGFMNPQTVLETSVEIDCSGRSAMNLGFYTDIPPRLVGTSEEIAHTIEVAVRRSFDFMKCPVILGGDSSIIPAILRGIEGQVKKFDVVAVENIDPAGNSLVITIDGNGSRCDLSTINLKLDQVKAIVVTGTDQVDSKNVVEMILDLCDRISA